MLAAATDWFARFATEGGLAALALAVLAVEALAVIALRARLGARARPLLLNAATGAVLMLIVLLAQREGPWWAIAALFTLAFGLHLADGALRLRGR